MKGKFHHPLWVHLPAFLMAVFGLFVIPLFMGANPHAAEIIYLGILSWMLLSFSVALDENFARKETHKTFNWNSLLDEAGIGAMVTGQINLVKSDLVDSWFYFLPFTLGIIIAIALEAIRPFRPYTKPAALTPEDVRTFEAELTERWQAGHTAVCWEGYTPSILLFLAGLALAIFLLFFAYFADFWWRIFVAVVLIGEIWHFQRDKIRVAVTPQNIRVSKGLFNFRSLTLTPQEIDEVDVYLATDAEDFRGYKTYGADMHRRYIFFSRRGNRYVRIVTKEGKKYLIAANHPDRLAAAIRAAQHAASQSARG